MSDLNLTSFNPLYPMRIHPYKELLNDSNVNIMDKVNAVIDYLNQVGKLTNDVVKDWNTVYQWVMNDGLTTDVNNKLEAMLANHEFDPIMNNILTKIGDLTTLQTADKDTLVHAINDLVTEIGSLSSLQTTDKSSIVNAINANVASLAQKATQIKGKVSLLDYYNSSDGSDYTNAFTNAFNYLTSVGGGVVQVPEGTFQALVNIPAHCGIEGVGEKSIIQSPANATTHTVQNNGVFVSIKNLTIDGNMANQTNTTIWALYLYSSQTASSDTAYYNLNDSYFNVDNVKVLNGKAGGFQVNARGESFFNRVHALNNGGDGIYIYAPDSMFTMCSSGQNFGHGFNILGGNNRLVNCKGWNNGQGNTGLTAGYGFYLNGCSNVYVQGEAQGNLLDGVYLNQAQLCTVDVFNDANGQNGGINSAGVSGFTLNNSIYNTIRGNVRNRKDRSQTKINYVVSLLGTCSDNIIDAQGLDISIGAFYDAGSNFISNLIKIRGNDVSNNKFEATTSMKTVTTSLASCTTWSQVNNLLPSGCVVVVEPQQIVNLIPNTSMFYGTATISKFSGSRLSVLLSSEVNGVFSYVGVLNNSTGNMDWKSISSNDGKYTTNGSGQTSVTLAHGLGIVPSFASATPASADAGTAGVKYVTVDANNITINFNNAAATGTNNLVFYYRAKP